MSTFIPHTIRIRIPDAAQVSLVGDFNNWHSNAHPLVNIQSDLWERIVDLPVGRHRYAFFVLSAPEVAQVFGKSRVIANGSVISVPSAGAHSHTIIPHPQLAIDDPTVALPRSRILRSAQELEHAEARLVA